MTLAGIANVEGLAGEAKGNLLGWAVPAEGWDDGVGGVHLDGVDVKPRRNDERKCASCGAQIAWEARESREVCVAGCCVVMREKLARKLEDWGLLYRCPSRQDCPTLVPGSLMKKSSKSRGNG